MKIQHLEEITFHFKVKLLVVLVPYARISYYEHTQGYQVNNYIANFFRFFYNCLVRSSLNII